MEITAPAERNRGPPNLLIDLQQMVSRVHPPGVDVYHISHPTDREEGGEGATPNRPGPLPPRPTQRSGQATGGGQDHDVGYTNPGSNPHRPSHGSHQGHTGVQNRVGPWPSRGSSHTWYQDYNQGTQYGPGSSYTDRPGFVPRHLQPPRSSDWRSDGEYNIDTHN